MLPIENFDHVGIRISKKQRSIDFYRSIGFELMSDVGFTKGHPVIMRHQSGVVINLLGPADSVETTNILMDGKQKLTGITHISFRVSSLNETKKTLQELNIPLTGKFSFKNMSAVFIRDPDRNVIELDAYSNQQITINEDYSEHPD